MIRTVPIWLAVVSGGLATLNPCGFPLLPAFLSFYVGAEQARLPRAPNRIAQALLVGLLVTVGFLAVFSAAGLPLIYGATLLTQALPWAGIGIGLALLGVGVAALAGRHVGVPLPSGLRAGRQRRASTMLWFGVGYGLASMGCTLPIFLTVVAASLGAGGAAASLVVFAAYGAGMAVVLMALAVGAALLRQGLARALRRLLPHLPRLTGALLVVAGAYLTYYWARLRFGPSATLSSDPVVGLVTRLTARLSAAAADAGALVVVPAGLVVLAAAIVGLWQWRRRGHAQRATTMPVGGDSVEP